MAESICALKFSASSILKAEQKKSQGNTSTAQEFLAMNFACVYFQACFGKLLSSMLRPVPLPAFFFVRGILLLDIMPNFLMPH
jgi:hypothetical protein